MNTQPLNIGGILRGALDVYKKNTGMFLKFGLIHVLYSLILNAGLYVMERAQGGLDSEGIAAALESPELLQSPQAYSALLASTGAAGAMGLMGVALLLITAYMVLSLTLIPKNQLGLQFYIAGAMDEAAEKPTLKTAYAKTKGRLGSFVGASILLGLIIGACMIPLVLAIVAMTITGFGAEELIWLMVPAVAAALLAAGPWFFLLAPVAAFGRGGGVLGQISALKRDNHWRALSVAVVAMLPGLLAGALAQTGVNFFVSAAISAAVNLFALGFSGAAQALTYRQLALPPAEEVCVPQETPSDEGCEIN